MAKKIDSYLRLQILAGGANPSPPVGPALGQAGLNIMDFCKEFNALTKEMENNAPIPVVITIYEDRSFTFITKTPPASYFLKKAIGGKKGSGEPNKVKIGKLTIAQLQKIAEEKMVDLNANDMDAAIKIIAGTARSMGIDVVGLGESIKMDIPADDALQTPANDEAPAEEVANEAPIKEAKTDAPAEEIAE